MVHSGTGEDANDVLFFGTNPSARVDVTLQQIPLSVAGSDRRPQLDELTLLDDGKTRKIEALVAAADQPLYVILLIDYSESMIEEMPVVKAAAKQFAEALLRPTDRIAVVGFNQMLFWLTPFTNDFNLVAAAIDRVKPGGETHLYDSAIEMLYELQKKPGRHALVVFTDGVDQGSRLKIEEAIRAAQKSDTVIYSIYYVDPSAYYGFGYFGGVTDGALKRMSEETGGRVFRVDKKHSLPEVFKELQDELRSQYAITYTPTNEKRDGSFRRIDLRTRDHNLKVQARKGYYATAPEKPITGR